MAMAVHTGGTPNLASIKTTPDTFIITSASAICSPLCTGGGSWPGHKK